MADLAVLEGVLADAVLLAVLELADVLGAVRVGVGALPVLLAVLELADVLEEEVRSVNKETTVNIPVCCTVAPA